MLPARAYDLIFARWVFLFVPDPADRIAQLAAALKPGGLLAIEDYERNTLRMLPAPAPWDASWRPTTRSSRHRADTPASRAYCRATTSGRALSVVDVTPTMKTGHPVGGLALAVRRTFSG